jgi:hypothetical protein
MLDYNMNVVLPVQNMFSRPVEITPYGTQPGQQPYGGRGVYITAPVDVVTEGNVVFSDHRSMLDIRLTEYPIPPGPRDWVFIPPSMSMPSAGPFEVQDVDRFHDGRARLTLRVAHVDEPRPLK